MGFDIEADRKDQKRQAEKEANRLLDREKRQALHDQKCESHSSIAKSNGVLCPQCGTPMKRGRKVTSSSSGQLFGCAILLFGFYIFWIFPFGTILGLLLMAGSVSMGVTRVKGNKCPKCKYFFETT